MASVVDGTEYLSTTFLYSPEHLWRNLGILFALMSSLCILYLLATDILTAQPSNGVTLVRRRQRGFKTSSNNDEETQLPHDFSHGNRETYLLNRYNTRCAADLKVHAATFVWDKLSYEVKVGGKSKRLLDDVEGWIRPASLTALMGASGAG